MKDKEVAGAEMEGEHRWPLADPAALKGDSRTSAAPKSALPCDLQMVSGPSAVDSAACDAEAHWCYMR